jgi:hypothetical protein
MPKSIQFIGAPMNCGSSSVILIKRSPLSSLTSAGSSSVEFDMPWSLLVSLQSKKAGD